MTANSVHSRLMIRVGRHSWINGWRSKSQTGGQFQKGTPTVPMFAAQVKREQQALAGSIEQPTNEPPTKPAVIDRPSASKKAKTKTERPSWPRSVSIGKPNREAGSCFLKKLETSERLTSSNHKNYGTSEMVDAIKSAVDAVHMRHPNSPVLAVGNLSKTWRAFSTAQITPIGARCRYRLLPESRAQPKASQVGENTHVRRTPHMDIYGVTARRQQG